MPSSGIPNLLSLMTFLPLLGAIVVMCLPRPRDLSAKATIGQDKTKPVTEDTGRLLVTWTAMGFTLLTFVISLIVFGLFNPHYAHVETRNMQFVENVDWISMGSLHIRYHMGVDGISLLLIVLTTLLMTLVTLFSFSLKDRIKEFMVFLLLLETGLIGVFCALDLVLFYFFWEAMLIPFYFLIGIFGSANRQAAALKFFLYTFAGSIFMLVAIIGIYQVSGSLDVVALSDFSSPAGAALRHAPPQTLLWMFGAFALAFMIKIPMFPFHSWLADTYAESPTAGNIISSGIMVKMGTYGFLRFLLPLFPAQAHSMAPLFITMAIISIIYGSMIAAVQTDVKRLLAYSSLAHLGFVILGIFTFTRIGTMGAALQNINHGISTPMLFFIVGMLMDRGGSRWIADYGGLKKVVPMLATMLLLATLSSLAVPFFNGFTGEFPILLGSWISSTTNSIAGYWTTALAGTGMILSAVYLLWWYQRLMLGVTKKAELRRFPDLNRTEWAVLLPLAGIIFWVGLGSTFWTQRMEIAVNTLLPAGTESLISADESPDTTTTQPVTAILEQYATEHALNDTGLGRRGNAPVRIREKPLHPVYHPATGGAAPSGGRSGAAPAGGAPGGQPNAVPNGSPTAPPPGTGKPTPRPNGKVEPTYQTLPPMLRHKLYPTAPERLPQGEVLNSRLLSRKEVHA
jgi:NADH-quinone oxidoreductase subunit M